VNLLVLCVAFAVLVAQTAFAADPLYKRTVNDKNPGGKDLVMTVEEVQRAEKTSEVKVTYRSGASVPSSMVIVRSLYDMAVARNAKYFIKLKESKAPDGDSLLLIGFSNSDRQPAKEYFGVAESEHGQAPQYLSVEQFAVLFGKAK
jgi:cytochrome c oxidase assembly protein Cox11